VLGCVGRLLRLDAEFGEVGGAELVLAEMIKGLAAEGGDDERAARQKALQELSPAGLPTNSNDRLT
jgi:hypothetical protein